MKNIFSHKKTVLGICGLLLIVLLLILLDAGKVIHPNRLLVSKKYCRGVDISHYQGNVDMAALAGQGIEFVYIKATEGSGHTDAFYEKNSGNAAGCGLLHGAYHFFSFDSDAKTQAAHFCDTVGNQEGCLIPAVDVEYYGDKEKNAPREQEFRASLQEYLDFVEAFYGCKPVIYTTLPFYEKYIRGYFDAYPLWIRNVYFPVYFNVGNRWSIWQYDDRTVLEGYDGQEPCIDMNVFHGKRVELENLRLDILDEP